MNAPAAAVPSGTDREAGQSLKVPRLLDERRGGALLHPTSLRGEGADGRGAIGAAARGFVDWLSAAGFSIWQMLPLGPPGAGGSPYWMRSDMAGQPSLIDRHELPDPERRREDYQVFLEDNRDWLEDYVLYEALTERCRSAWWLWPEPYRTRDADALARFAIDERAQLERRRLEQWYFDWQWRQLRRYARERGVYLFGDLPIYVAPDSAATWAHREQFQLDVRGRPTLLAGVPPDYFSAEGQLWGNPVYHWEQAQLDHFQFWRTRLRQQLRRFDLLRIDHFRGLAAYWAVPAGSRTAREGRWYPAPGQALFAVLREEFPQLPVVAEDLGLITPDVDQLRSAFGLPGMRVLQFAFDGSADNPHLPHNYATDLVAYTGTHDNDTIVGWCQKLTPEVAERVRFYLNAAADLAESLVRACLSSVAHLAVIPAQDVLRLDSSARLNTPGTTEGNWGWKMPDGALTPSLAAHYRALNGTFGRLRESAMPPAASTAPP